MQLTSVISAILAASAAVASALPQESKPCSNTGERRCITGTMFETCGVGRWVMQSCAPGTFCRNVEGGGIMCDTQQTENAPPMDTAQAPAETSFGIEDTNFTVVEEPKTANLSPPPTCPY